MNTAERIIERFGGISALARALGHRHPTTVQGWKQRGVIPARRQADVLAAAKAQNLTLSAEDFFAPRGRIQGEKLPAWFIVRDKTRQLVIVDLAAAGGQTPRASR